jgi:rfaE bifunctional protein nucleotidyltransferase chain/domain
MDGSVQRNIAADRLPAKVTQSGLAGREGRSTSKVLPLDTLATVCVTHRREGRKVVLCHGVFDLLHVGHMRHLQAARELGDVLVVTITADQHVNKGPDRPAFPAEVRAECLAGLEFVDHVATVDDPSAAPAIRAVKPRYYVKGREYAEANSDLTGKILLERELVEGGGGELMFTDDITYSSSNLLNKHFTNRGEELRDYLDQQREQGLQRRVAGLLDRIAQLRILIIGETIIDRYTYVAPMGKAAKENIIATLYQDEEIFAGGVIAVANDLSAICPNVELVTMLGDPRASENFEDFIRKHLDASIEMSVIYRPQGPTVQKTRFVEPTYVRKLFEVYHMDDQPLPGKVQDDFHEQLRNKIRRADVVIVNDFGHGLIAPSTVDLLQAEARFLAVNAQSNAGNIGYNLISKYGRANFVCLDAMEARLAVHDKHASLTEIVARRLPKVVDCPNVIVTHGRSGCYASDGRGEAIHIPAFNQAVVDTVGAGDAFFANAASMVAAGADCPTAGFMGNVAGAISIGIIGHRRYLNKLEIQRYVSALLK